MDSFTQPTKLPGSHLDKDIPWVSVLVHIHPQILVFKTAYFLYPDTFSQAYSIQQLLLSLDDCSILPAVGQIVTFHVYTIIHKEILSTIFYMNLDAYHSYLESKPLHACSHFSVRSSDLTVCSRPAEPYNKYIRPVVDS